MKRALILGGYGTFGSLVAKELAASGASLTIAGRDGSEATKFAFELGDRHRGIAVDINDRVSIRKAVSEHVVVVNCAGPFSELNTDLIDAVLESKCQYVDIGDDRPYVAYLRSRHRDFAAAGVAALFGCSSLPAISGALALRLLREVSATPQAATITLLVGNNNPKGIAAISSMLRTLGRPIPAPQSNLIGFRDSQPVAFPPPFGRRRNYPAESPEYDLFPDLLGVQSVRVGFCFELSISNWLMSALARMPFRYGKRTARLLAAMSAPFRRLGSSGGAVLTELSFADGTRRSAALVAKEGGQRMAALPCALAVHALLQGQSRPGVGTAYDLLGAEELLDKMVRQGFRLDIE